MAALTAKAVNNLLQHCLSDGSEAVTVKGIMTEFSFSKAKLEEHRQEILDLLYELPDPFMMSEGGGWSFLQAALDKHHNHWGEHSDMESLFCLGMGLGVVDYVLPRAAWGMFPGGMPYLYIKDSHEDHQQVS